MFGDMSECRCQRIGDETAHVAMPVQKTKPKTRLCSFKWPASRNPPSTRHLKGERCKNDLHRDVKFCNSCLSLIARAERWSGNCRKRMQCNNMAQYVLSMHERFGVNLKNVPLKVALETVCNMDALTDPEFVDDE